MNVKSERSRAADYLLAHPEALGFMRYVKDGKAHAPEEIRKGLDLHAETFRRTRQALAAFRLITVRAVKGADWRETPDGHLTLEVEIVLGPAGRQLLPFLNHLAQFARAHKGRVPSAVIEEAGAWG
jgi:hypothetical protein